MIVRCRELKLRAVGLAAATENGFHCAVDGRDGALALRSLAATVGRAMKRLRVLVLLDPDLVPPDSHKGYSEQEINTWKTEYDVVSTLRANGHDVRPLGVQHELKPIRDEIESWKPNVVFNLLEQFHGEAAYDQNVASLLELMRVPYTGCNPRGLMLARGKDLSKKLLSYHRIPSPAFVVFPMRRKIRRPTRLRLPLIVKSLSEDASLGISQASVVDTDEKLVERVTFVHESIGTAAIAEEYIEGRELYVGVLGNDRLRVLPIWELEFRHLGAGHACYRHREGQARSGLSGASRHLPRAGAGPRTGIARAYPKNRKTDLPHARARRLCPHRFPPLCGWHPVLHRSQSQSRDCQHSGICTRGCPRRPCLSRFAESNFGIRHSQGEYCRLNIAPLAQAHNSTLSWLRKLASAAHFAA